MQIFATNLAAPFILKHFRDEFLELLPYVDILFGNEREGEVFAEANHYNTHELHEICVEIAEFSKVYKFYGVNFQSKIFFLFLFFILEKNKSIIVICNH